MRRLTSLTLATCLAFMTFGSVADEHETDNLTFEKERWVDFDKNRYTLIMAWVRGPLDQQPQFEVKAANPEEGPYVVYALKRFDDMNYLTANASLLASSGVEQAIVEFWTELAAGEDPAARAAIGLMLQKLRQFDVKPPVMGPQSNAGGGDDYASVEELFDMDPINQNVYEPDFVDEPWYIKRRGCWGCRKPPDRDGCSWTRRINGGCRPQGND